MTLSADARVARITTRQHGLVTLEQALGAGMTMREIERRVELEVLHRVDRGTFHHAGAPFTWSTKVLAAVLALSALASHRSGAVLWKVGGVREGRPEVTVARPARFRREGVRVHESRDLHLATRRVVDGIPVTGVDRTLVDLGAVVPWTVVEDAVLDALDRRLVTWPLVLSSYAKHARPGRRGCGALRRVIDRNVKQAVPGSRLELRCERVLERAGLPLPERQVVIDDHGGTIGRVDFAYVDARIVIEVDGRSIHARRAAFEADALRRSRLAASGWVVIHVTWEQLYGDPNGVVGRITRALARTHTAP